jgi:hypothetical protein
MLERKATQRYFLELGIALALYVVVLWLSLTIGRSMADSRLRTLLLITPIVPIALAIWAIARGVRRMDEFVRLKSLELIAISAAVTAGWTLTYGFLEIAGFPRLSMFTVWMVMGSVWGFLACVRKIAGR